MKTFSSQATLLGSCRRMSVSLLRFCKIPPRGACGESSRTTRPPLQKGGQGGFRQQCLLTVGILLYFATHVFAQQPSTSVSPIQQAAVPPVNQYAIFDTFLTCEEANRTAHQSVERLGYKVTSFTPARTTVVGVIKGSRSFIWGDQETVTVKITCKPDGIAVDAQPDIPPCEQANRISRLAVERLGYNVTEFTPAAMGKPGMVKGDKAGQPQVYIALFCSPENVTLDTSADSPLLRNNDFYAAITDFHRGFAAVYKAQRHVVAAPSTAPTKDQVQVAMKPLYRADTKTVFGAEVTTIFPVQVEITNSTKRSYQLETDKIALVSITGERVKPLAEKGNAFPAQALANQSIASGGKVKGYLYYPVGTYTGARGSLVEEKSQEREGFEVPF